MIEIKAFVHRSRAASVVRALRKGGFANMTAVDVKGSNIQRNSATG